MGQYEKLRQKYPRFFYRGYDIRETEEQLMATYHFEIEGLSSFSPRWTFRKPGGRRAADGLMDQMIFALGMVELISYWKIACCPQVIVETGVLDRDQVRWWKNLYFNGLGEFFYVNHIQEAAPENFMEIICADEPAPVFPAPNPVRSLAQGILVPIGGGKDSAVTLELLRSIHAPVTGYIINPRGASIQTARIAGLDEAHLMIAKRTLDENMLELNRQGYLNGHTPFSALVAFSGIIQAKLLGLHYVALSNESSANESTIPGSTVNHQYSKSFKFEEDFHCYTMEYLKGSPYYFSMLRPLSEFQIAKYFAKQKKYHGIFRSCNAGSKTDSWCGHCSKCLFVCLILSPFLSVEEVRDIFGTDMLEDMTMTETLNQLVGIREDKPFECVGSRGEINTAIVMTIDRLEKQRKPLPALLAYYKRSGVYETAKAAGDRYSSFYDNDNLLPKPLDRLVRESCVETSAFLPGRS